MAVVEVAGCLSARGRNATPSSLTVAGSAV